MGKKDGESIVQVAIVNVTGYAGVELARLLSAHPCARLISVTGRSEVGKKVGEVFPHLGSIDLNIEAQPGKADIVFCTLPHKASAEAILPLIDDGSRVIDISADFRLHDKQAYEQWYGFVHPAPDILKIAIYGLPELHRNEIASAQLVANPGCYPTGAILALTPAVQRQIVEPDIIIDSKSGVSGAGRALSLGTHYSEVNENFRAYAVGGHRHFPEINQELGLLSSESALSITFLPHLVPMTRGIFTSCYAKLREDWLGKVHGAKDALMDIYREFYRDEPFVRIVTSPPETKHTWGSNYCHIYPTLDQRTGRLIVLSCIDNLVKGAAGQAIQSMNIMCGFPETMGLAGLAMYP
ncbi:MAG: N-acetyl-gamma-glutamyl-phosphate reductase [Chloroflexota bacterium]|nr:N-acetyl-gamma-glutamyl-phosphate reductase [Chloroflexota bacterium]